MTRITSVEVICKCGAKIFRYQKAGTGRLIKCFLSKIIANYIHLPRNIKTGENVFCASCQKRIGTVQMIHGEPAVKLNQGQIQPVRIG